MSISQPYFVFQISQPLIWHKNGSVYLQMDLSFQGEKQFVILSHGLQVTTIFVIWENSGVFFKRLVPPSKIANTLNDYVCSTLSTTSYPTIFPVPFQYSLPANWLIAKYLVIFHQLSIPTLLIHHHSLIQNVEEMKSLISLVGVGG